MRLLYVAADPALTIDQLGGAGTHMRGTIEPLRAQGIEVQVAIGSPESRSEQPTSAQRPAPGLRRAAPEPVRLLGRDLRLLAHGRAFRSATFDPFDCVYERSAYLLDVGRPLARERGVPYAIETDGIMVSARRATYGTALHRYGERLERSKIRSADLVAVMSKASRNEVAERYGIPESRVLVKGLGVEAALVERAWPAKTQIDVGWAGTFQAYHGVELLVEALRLLGTASALLVGDGPGRADVAAATQRLPVELPGLVPREQALERLAGCRVLVIPESAETVYPVKLLEYAALGRPVVCPRRPAFDEFESDRGALLFGFQPGDPADLARAITEALAATGDRADRLRDLVAREYTWDAVARRLADGFRRLVGHA